MTVEKEAQPSQLLQSVEDEVQKAISNNLKLYKVAIVAFISGFVLFLSVGVFTKGEMFKAVIKSIYPPREIYKDIVNEFANDKDFTLNTFPKLEKEIPIQVWNTVSEGSEEDFEKMIAQDAFFNALVKYHTDVAKSFLLPTSSTLERAHKIMEVGKLPLPVQLLMAGKDAEGKQTATCYKQFRNDELQAIMVIPKSVKPEEYSWFNCAFGWPTITLKVNDVDGIELVGVRRNGKTNKLIMLLSRKAAERLELPGWRKYSSNTFGKVKITNAE